MHKRPAQRGSDSNNMTRIRLLEHSEAVETAAVDGCHHVRHHQRQSLVEVVVKKTQQASRSADADSAAERHLQPDELTIALDGGDVWDTALGDDDDDGAVYDASADADRRRAEIAARPKYQSPRSTPLPRGASTPRRTTDAEATGGGGRGDAHARLKDAEHSDHECHIEGVR